MKENEKNTPPPTVEDLSRREFLDRVKKLSVYTAASVVVINTANARLVANSGTN